MSREIGPFVLEGVVLDERFEIGFVEACESLGVPGEAIVRLIEEGLVEVHGESPYAWRFGARDFLRLRSAIRLQRELGLNPEGAALAVELLEALGRLP